MSSSSEESKVGASRTSKVWLRRASNHARLPVDLQVQWSLHGLVLRLLTAQTAGQFPEESKDQFDSGRLKKDKTNFVDIVLDCA